MRENSEQVEIRSVQPTRQRPGAADFHQVLASRLQAHPSNGLREEFSAHCKPLRALTSKDKRNAWCGR